MVNDKNLAGLTAANTAPMAIADRKINSHQPAILALLGDTRFFTKLLVKPCFAKKNAINRTTIMPPPMAKSLEPVCSCMVGIPTACAVCVTAVVACWVASLACGMTKP